MSIPKHITDKEMAEAIKACGGKLTLAAERLRCAFSTVYNRVNKVPKLQRVVEREREAFIDLAEMKLKQAVIGGEPWAIKLLLKCQGKKRGWVENPVNVNEQITVGIETAFRSSLVDLSKVSPEEILRAMSALDRLKKAALESNVPPALKMLEGDVIDVDAEDEDDDEDDGWD